MNRRQKLVQRQFLNNEKAVITRLQYIYDQSLFEINAKIRNLDFAIDELREVYDWLDDDDPAKEIIRSKIQSKIYQKQYQQVLQDQVAGILKQMQKDQYLTISDYLDTCYEDGFVGSLFDLHGQNVPMMLPIDQEAMVRAVQLESKISEGLYTKLGEDVDVLKKRITSEITRSIATGASWEQVAQRLAGQTKIGFNKAVRIARTEGHRIQCAAANDAAHGARDRGADVMKQWDATLDGKTRPSHRKVDGEIRELDEPFSNGLMFPGDSDGAAGEVINCRCAYLQRARWAISGGFTKWNNFTGQLESFESPEAYEEFKKGFFSDENTKYMNYVQKMQDKYGTKNFAKVLDQMSEREYQQYSGLLTNNPVYNKNAKPKTKDQIHGTFTAYQAETTKLKARYAEVNGTIDRYYWDSDQRNAHGISRQDQREWKRTIDIDALEKEFVTLTFQMDGRDDVEGILQYIDGKKRKVSGTEVQEYRMDSYNFGDGTSKGVYKTVSAKVYRTTDGTEIVYPEKYSKRSQTLKPEQAIECWSRVPESIRIRGQHQIEVVDYANPQDAYWRKIYEGFSGSYMTGGDTITVYKYTHEHDVDYMVGVFAHESAHGMDHMPDGSRFSDTKTWKRAMRKDEHTSGKKSPTSYGENSNAEDFAESMFAYVMDRENFEKTFPERARLIHIILGE